GSEGSVTLLEVVPESEPLRKPFGAVTMSSVDVLKMLNDLAREDLDKAATDWSPLAPEVPIERLIGQGDATTVILQAAIDHQIDMIALASAARGAVGRLALGSVSDKVMRESEIPVLIVRQDPDKEERVLPKVGRVIVALDGSDRSMLGLPVAAALGKQLGAAVVLLTAVDLPQVVSPVMGYAPAFSPDIYSQLEDESTAAAHEHLDEAVAQMATYGVTANSQVTVGFAVDSIIDYAKPDDLIVLTTRGQGGFKRWIMGSVAERLVRESPAPVVVVPSHHHE
ncbi:MAG TPA: universal stress protein, partial [Thermomicrobiales bacterium]|nr:universal stress protein [Thermomicrobiales bacterium]